jgi:hypothetical protein
METASSRMRSDNLRKNPPKKKEAPIWSEDLSTSRGADMQLTD